MKIEIKDKEIELRFGYRALMVYENIIGNVDGLSELSQMITLFYATILASEKELTISFDEYLDWLDDKQDIFEDFCYFVAEKNKRNEILSPIVAPQDNIEKSKKKE